MLKADPYEIVADHICRTIPDSISQRKELLDALNQILPRTHPQTKQVCLSLSLLWKHEVAQRELRLSFDPPPTDTTNATK